MENVEKKIEEIITVLLSENEKQQEEISTLKKEIESQKEFYEKELHHILRYYSRKIRQKTRDVMGWHPSEKKLPKKKSEVSSVERKGNCQRLYTLWKEPSTGYNPQSITSLLSDTPLDIPSYEMLIDVIIPVYNGLHHLRRLLPSIFKNTTQAHRFIFIDDNSSDPEVKKFLHNELESREDCILLENEENMGFPETVNRAAKSVTSEFFVILNTDVIVPDKWLERMISPFMEDSKICTTTPFTNAGVFYSFPNFGEDYHMKEESEMAEWDLQFQRIRILDTDKLEFINGTGYCMGIRKKCWDELGGFDAKTFERGYGEETDLCLRYLDKGWKNVLVPNLFVFHNHGGSFPSEEKKALTQAHLNIIQQRWGKYIDLIQYFVSANPWASYRLAALAEKYKSLTDVLIIDLNDTNGGACKFRMQQEQRLLKEGKKIVSLLYSNDRHTQWSLTFANSDGRASFTLKDWEQCVQWIHFFEPKEFFVNNLAFNYDFQKVLAFFEGNIAKTLIPYTATSIPSNIIDKTHPVEIDVDIDADNLIEVSIPFATYNRENHVELNLCMYAEDNSMLFSTIINAQELTDNSEYTIPVSINETKKKRIRKITITSEEATNLNAVSIYKENDYPCFSYMIKDKDNSKQKKSITYCYHDFFSCCPSFFLLSKNNMFCNYDHCQACLSQNPNRIYPYNDIEEWRKIWGNFLSRCSQFRFFSENTYHLVSKVYHLPNNKVIIKGHDSLAQFNGKYVPPAKEAPLHIAVIGAWYESKGSKQVIELASLLRYASPESRIYFYGNIDAVNESKIKERHSNIIFRGKYDIANMPILLSNDSISVVFFSSVYPETFSFVTKECIDMGVPIVSFNIGASGDRVKSYEKGYIAESFSAVDVYKKLLEAKSNQIHQK